jgi:hypothetical protein
VATRDNTSAEALEEEEEMEGREYSILAQILEEEEMRRRETLIFSLPV